MRVRHSCLVVNIHGDRVIMTGIFRNGEWENGASRSVTARDWHDVVVPSFVHDGCVRTSTSPNGDCVWEKEF